MSYYANYILTLVILIGTVSCSQSQQTKKESSINPEISKTAEEWKKELTPEEYHVLREKGTERAFSGDLWDNKSEGIYVCAACQTKLFTSDTKFRSGTGWPSFWDVLNEDNVALVKDTSLGMVREEVVCATCGGHLGHVFGDGPKPTGLRYCINSVSLDFVSENE